MKPFEGSWKCDTKFAANAFGPGSPEVMAKSSVKFKKDLEGFFYRGEYEIKKQKGVEMPMKGIFYIGYDPGSAQVVVTGVDTMGGVGTGAGKIEGDAVTYTGEQYIDGDEGQDPRDDGQARAEGRLPQARDGHGQGLRPVRRRHLQEVASGFSTGRAV